MRRLNLVLIAVFMTGCQSTATSTTMTGRYFDARTVNSLIEGMSKDLVLQRLGTPQYAQMIQDEERTEVWTYSYAITKTVEAGRGLVAQDVTICSVVLSFLDGRLARKGLHRALAAHADTLALRSAHGPPPQRTSSAAN